MTSDDERDPIQVPHGASGTLDWFSMAIIEAQLPADIRAPVYDALVAGQPLDTIEARDSAISATLAMLGNRPLCHSIGTWISAQDTLGTVAANALAETALYLVMSGVEPDAVLTALRQRYDKLAATTDPAA